MPDVQLVHMVLFSGTFMSARCLDARPGLRKLAVLVVGLAVLMAPRCCSAFTTSMAHHTSTKTAPGGRQWHSGTYVYRGVKLLGGPSDSWRQVTRVATARMAAAEGGPESQSGPVPTMAPEPGSPAPVKEKDRSDTKRPPLSKKTETGPLQRFMQRAAAFVGFGSV